MIRKIVHKKEQCSAGKFHDDNSHSEETSTETELTLIIPRRFDDKCTVTLVKEEKIIIVISINEVIGATKHRRTNSSREIGRNFMCSTGNVIYTNGTNFVNLV